MRHFLLWLCGYVQIRLNGKQINRFLNLCSRNGISLWRISYDAGRMVHAYVKLHDFYKLKTYLRKSKTHLKVIHKRGFPFWCHRHPRLKWFFVIVVCIFCLGLYSYTYIWTIKISGNSIISSQDILRCLETADITTGKKRNDIDCTDVEYLLRDNFHQLGWVTVYMDHTNLCIDIKESIYDDFDDYPIEDGKRYDLVSNRDAVIYSIVTRSGTPVVHENMTIRKGDVLVLGECEIYDDIGEIKEIMYVCADALIYGDVTYHLLYPVTEIEIAALKLAGVYSNKSLTFFANEKMDHILEKLKENGVIILDKNVMIDKKEKCVVLLTEIKTREQIGINIPVEENREYEFE